MENLNAKMTWLQIGKDIMTTVNETKYIGLTLDENLSCKCS